MENLSLLGIFAICYSALTMYIVIKKPVKIWEMRKIKNIKKLFGEKGTVIFFYIWSFIFLGLGIWLLLK